MREGRDVREGRDEMEAIRLKTQDTRLKTQESGICYSICQSHL